MLIWINGVRGVGKTTVSSKLLSKMKKRSSILLNSDEFFTKMFDENNSAIFYSIGTHPYNNKYFSYYFRNTIEHYLKQRKIVIVDIALIDNECKTNIYEYLNDKYKSISFILSCSKENLINRICNDSNRKEKKEQIYELDKNIKFLEQNYEKSIIINTDNQSIDETVNLIISFIKERNNEKDVFLT